MGRGIPRTCSCYLSKIAGSMMMHPAEEVVTNHGEHAMQVLEGSFGADSASVPRDSIWVRLPSPYRLTVTQ